MKWWEIILDHILRGDMCVPLVPEVAVPALHVVSGKVLTSCHDALVFWVETALKTIDQSMDVAGKMKWIFSGSFLSSSPSRIFEGVLRCKL